MDVVVSGWADKGVMGLVIAMLTVAVALLYNANVKSARASVDAAAAQVVLYIDLLRQQLKCSDDMTHALEALTDNLKARNEIERITRRRS